MDEEEREETSRFGCVSEICDAIMRALDESSASEFWCQLSRSAGRLNGCIFTMEYFRACAWICFAWSSTRTRQNLRVCHTPGRKLEPFGCVCGRGGMCRDGLLRDSLSILGLIRLDTKIFSHGPMKFDGTVGICV